MLRGIEEWDQCPRSGCKPTTYLMIRFTLHMGEIRLSHFFSPQHLDGKIASVAYLSIQYETGA